MTGNDNADRVGMAVKNPSVNGNYWTEMQTMVYYLLKAWRKTDKLTSEFSEDNCNYRFDWRYGSKTNVSC
jgi:hypothetical protein